MGLGGRIVLVTEHQRSDEWCTHARLGIASATLATLRQTGMVTSFAVALAVAAGSLPSNVVMALFVGTNITPWFEHGEAFVTGIHSAFLVSAMLCLVAAGFSLVRGKENRQVQVDVVTD